MYLSFLDVMSKKIAHPAVAPCINDEGAMGGGGGGCFALERRRRERAKDTFRGYYPCSVADTNAARAASPERTGARHIVGRLLGMMIAPG